MIVKSVLLPLAPDAAFELFTRRINDWWPSDRRHLRDANGTIVLLSTGRFYERAGDGREAELGAVRRWEPPTRILLDFFIATGPEHPTEAEIIFAAEENSTRVTVTHRSKPVSAHLWAERAPRYERSWENVLLFLGRFAA